MQEDEMTLRAAMLEQENLRLRLELEHMRAEVDQLRMIVFSPTISPVRSAIITTPTAFYPSQSQLQQSLQPTIPLAPLLSQHQQHQQQEQPTVSSYIALTSSTTTDTVNL